MSVVGIDFGNANNIVALARRKGIDVVLNDESKRETPSMINFGEKQRFIGCAAGDKINMQPKNTVSQLKRLIGRKYKDPEVQADLANVLFPHSEGPNGEIMITVNYLGEQKTFTVERLVAMVLSDLKLIAEKDNGTKCTDCVLSIPVFADDAQRRAMLDAASICGLNVLRLMHETTATSLAYGIFKTAEFTDDPTNVVFVDIGHASLQACVVQFTKKGMKVLATGFDRNCGGRDFDEALFHHFCDEFKQTKKIDIKSNARASHRLKVAIEKMKKILSANPEAPIGIECIMDEIDVKSKMTRDMMNELAASTLDRLMGPIKKAMEESGVAVSDIAAVELVGNASRMPAIAEQLQEYFGKQPGRTLNASECVARGCALQGAMLSPQFRVRDFDVVDSFPYPVTFTWQAEDGTPKDMQLFERNNTVPSSKMMTFFRNETFTLQAKYHSELLSPGADLNIGQFDVGPIPPPTVVLEDGAKQKLKLKVRLNLDGLVSVEQAQTVEEIEEDAAAGKDGEDSKMDEASAADKGANGEGEGTGAEGGNKGGDKMDTDTPAADKDGAAAADNKGGAKKKKVKKVDVPVKPVIGGLPPAVLQQFTQEEYDMALQDRVMEETKERKNAVEEYILSMRGKLYDVLEPYVDETTRESFSSLLTASEDWLYEDGEDETKGVYVAKLEELKAVGDPITLRYTEASARGPAAAALTQCANAFLAMCGDDAHTHIDQADRDKVAADCNAALSWLQEKQALQEQCAKTAPPVLLSTDIVKKQEALTRFANPIMSRPKPAPKPEPKPEEANPAEDAPKNGEAQPMDADGAAPAEGEAAPTPMQADDLD